MHYFETLYHSDKLSYVMCCHKCHSLQAKLAEARKTVAFASWPWVLQLLPTNLDLFAGFEDVTVLQFPCQGNFIGAALMLLKKISPQN